MNLYFQHNVINTKNTFIKKEDLLQGVWIILN